MDCWDSPCGEYTKSDRGQGAPVGGAYVVQSTPVTRIHDFGHRDEPPIEICAGQVGYVRNRKCRAVAEPGERPSPRVQRPMRMSGENLYFTVYSEPQNVELRTPSA
jgi:hypothetical protein